MCENETEKSTLIEKYMYMYINYVFIVCRLNSKQRRRSVYSKHNYIEVVGLVDTYIKW